MSDDATSLSAHECKQPRHVATFRQGRSPKSSFSRAAKLAQPLQRLQHLVGIDRRPILPRGTMRTFIALALMVGCSTATTATAAPSDIPVQDSRDDSSITEGETTLQVDPDTAYKAVTDYKRWRTIFPGVREVIITREQGVDALVTFVHPDGNRDNIHFHNQPAARMVWFEDTGGRATVWAEIMFLPGAQPGTTRVHTRLYADVKGIASLVVTDSRIRSMREQRVRSDLAALRAYFNPSVAKEQ